MSLTKSSMRNLLLRRKGIGVKVITVTGESFFFFYEDFDDSKGITRARKHFRFNEHLVFFTNKWAQQSAFAEYMDHYKKLLSIAENYPDDIAVQETFQNYKNFVIARLRQYTGFSTRKAAKQVLEQRISFNKFTEVI